MSEPKRKVTLIHGEKVWAHYREMGGLATCHTCHLPVKGKWYTKLRGKFFCQVCRPFRDEQ